MNKFKVIFIIVFTCFFSFCCIGYAAVIDDISVTGNVITEAQEKVFITDAVYSEGNSTGTLSSVKYLSSIMNSTINLGNANNAKVTIKVTVYNNANEAYGFNAVKYGTSIDDYSNSNVEYTLTDLERYSPSKKTGTVVEVGAFHTFYITFNYVDGNKITDTTLTSILNFEFLPLTEITEDVTVSTISGVLDRFKEVLNTTSDYNTLINQMNDTVSWWESIMSGGRSDNSYIGTVVGSTTDDTGVLEGLFLGNLYINIDGKKVDVTIMIKRENVDNNRNTGDSSGNEMSIYMTSANLTTNGVQVPCYAGVFTRTKDSSGNYSEWDIVGEMFTGSATVNGYNGTGSGGSVNTDTWRQNDANGNRNNSATITVAIDKYI